MKKLRFGLVGCGKIATCNHAPEMAKLRKGKAEIVALYDIKKGRAEAFASKNSPWLSFLDGLGMGVGFTLALMALGAVREFLGAGTIFELQLFPKWEPFLLMKFAPGAFFVLGFFLAGMNMLRIRRARLEGRTYTPPELNCSQCNLCDLGKR